MIWAASWQNQPNGMGAQWRLRSFWASAQSDQSLRCVLDWWLRTQAFFMQTAMTLIRLGGCPGWSKSSLGAHAILLVLSWGGLFQNRTETTQAVTDLIQFVCLFWGFMAQSTLLRSCRNIQLTYPHCSWAGCLSGWPVLSGHTFASNWQLPYLNQQ